jgi:sterol desaturase/sphingolipid hydroxylase (fatty acid hydroxylase superfamily)
MIQFFNDWVLFFANYAGRIFMAASVIMLAEYLLPQSKYSLISRLRGALFWIVYVIITALGFILFHRLWDWIGIKPLFHVDLTFLSKSSFPPLAVLGGIVASLAVIQVGEFFYYWFHRLQHSSKLLWRFHAEHHALEEMSAFNCNHHFTEEIFRIPFITIPLSLLFSFDQGYVPWIWAFLIGWQGIYEHSCTRLNLGWFRYIVPDNRFHRIRHSKEPKHFDKNFGSASALWDIVFGTAHYPRKDEWPDVGLEQMKEATNLRQFLFRAFRR